MRHTTHHHIGAPLSPTSEGRHTAQRQKGAIEHTISVSIESVPSICVPLSSAEWDSVTGADGDADCRGAEMPSVEVARWLARRRVPRRAAAGDTSEKSAKAR